MSVSEIVSQRANFPMQQYSDYGEFVSDVWRTKSACASNVVSLACLVDALVVAADSWAIKAFGHRAQARTTNKFVSTLLNGSPGPAISSTHISAFVAHKLMLIELEQRIAAGKVPSWCMPRNIEYINIRDFNQLMLKDKITLLQSIPSAVVAKKTVAAALAAKKNPGTLEGNAIPRAKMMAVLGTMVDKVCSKAVLERNFGESTIFCSRVEAFEQDLLEKLGLGDKNV